jgi:hypothetical protein
MSLNNKPGEVATFWNPITKSEFSAPADPLNKKQRLIYTRNGVQLMSDIAIEDIRSLIDRVKALEEALIEQYLLGSKNE